MRYLSLRKRFREYRERLFAPETDWIQVEVSSYCNASCVYCPRTVYRDNWMNRNLSPVSFERLLPAIANTELVFLQGWGEPFLDPDIFDMIAAAKKVGCQVGTTTNGMLLDSRRIKSLVESGIDIISFSIAGLDNRNDLLRQGTRLKTVLDTIQRLRQEKKNRGSTKPAIHVSYLLLRSGLKDLARLPDVLQGFGIDLIVISTLDFVPARRFENEALCPGDMAEYEELCFLLDYVTTKAEGRGVRVHCNFKGADKTREICSENPQRSFYVSSDGSISPCVFTNLPGAKAAYRFHGEELPYRRLAFGNISNHSVSAIWQQRDYRAFRQSFDTGQLKPVCRKCYKLFVL